MKGDLFTAGRYAVVEPFQVRIKTMDGARDRTVAAGEAIAIAGSSNWSRGTLRYLCFCGQGELTDDMAWVDEEVLARCLLPVSTEQNIGLLRLCKRIE